MRPDRGFVSDMRVSDLVGRITFERLAISLLIVSLAAGACLMPAQNDTWWHLRAGQLIWESRSVSLQDHFSHTVAGAYWPDHEWLTQALFFLLYSLGGMPLLTGFAAALVVASLILVWQMTPGPFRVRFLLCLLAIMPSATQWSVRPHVVTLLAFTSTAFLLTRRRFILLPLVFLLWANAHGAVLLGVVMVGTVALVSVVRKRSLLTREIIAAAFCAGATVCTPLGLRFWTDLPASIMRNRLYQIDEWRPPALSDLSLLGFWVLAGVLLVLVVVDLVRKGPALAEEADLQWAALALLPIALGSARNVVPFVLLAVPAVGRLLQHQLPLCAARKRTQRPRLNAAILGAACLAACAVVAAAWTQQIARLNWHPLNPRILSSIESCPPNLYNRYDEGGYLIWFTPTHKVFMDGRQDPYPTWMVREHMETERSGSYQAVFRRYGIKCAFVPAESVMAHSLRRAGWRESYADDRWAVLTNPRMAGDNQ
jgi:hypothetical protein